MSRPRSASSYGPGTVKEHVDRIKGKMTSTAPVAPVYKQSIASDPAAAAAAAAAADAPLSSLVVVPQSATRVDYLRFKGCKHFRERLVCATLAGRAIRIDDIRAMDEQPGIRGTSTAQRDEQRTTGQLVTVTQRWNVHSANGGAADDPHDWAAGTGVMDSRLCLLTSEIITSLHA